MSKKISTAKSSYGNLQLCSTEHFKKLVNDPGRLEKVRQVAKDAFAMYDKAKKNKLLEHPMHRSYAVGKRDMLYRYGGPNAIRVTRDAGVLRLTNGSITVKFNRVGKIDQDTALMAFEKKAMVKRAKKVIATTKATLPQQDETQPAQDQA